MTLLLCLFALACGLLCLPLLHAADAPAEPRRVRCGSAGGPDPGAIPRLVWAYWHSGEPPLVVERCLRSWQHLNPDYRVTLISGSNLTEFAAPSELPENFSALSPARQSDWLRLYLLRRYGGIWLDASIILTGSLDWMRALQSAERADFVGFYLERYTQRPDCPVIDSWCLAAPADSPFMRDWHEEFSMQALALGDEQYLARLRAEGVYDSLVQAIASPDYMVIHVCAQRVLQRGGAYRLCLIRAEDSAYFYQHRGRWKRPLLFLSMLVLRQARRPPALIKLRGGERRKLEPYLQRGFYSRGSLAAQILMRG